MATQNAELVLTAQKSIDGKHYKLVGLQHVPWASSVEYLAAVPSTRRHIGQISYVLNSGVIEIWQFIGGIADINHTKIFPQTTSSVTADNGLTLASGNIKLGGTLTANTTLTAGATHLLVTGTGATGPVLQGQGTTGTGIKANSDSGIGLEASSNTGPGILVGGISAVPILIDYNPEDYTNVFPAIKVQRHGIGIGSPGIGMGTSIDFGISDSTGAYPVANKVVSKWLDPTAATATSEFSIQGINSGSVTVLLQISGSGIFTLPRSLRDFADDAAAAAGTPAIPVNGLYRTGSIVKMRVS